jgi:magnesium-transporting ATPase (P-type)
MKLAKYAKKMDHDTMGNMITQENGFTRIGFFVFIMLISCHIFACFWCAMSLFDPHNWMILKIAALQDTGEVISVDDQRAAYVIALYLII